MAGWIAAGQEVGGIRPELDPTRQAAVFVGAIRGLTLQWLLEPDRVDLPALLDELATTFTSGLARDRP